MRFQAVKIMMTKNLGEKLPPHLTYHSLEHTLDVIKTSEEIGKSENIDISEMTLLKTAALFHDSGYIYGPQDHEEKSCEIARKILPDYNYTSEQIDIIEGMIRATKIPQNPQNHLEEILADADLDYLGRDDFFEIGKGLFEELKYFNVLSTETEWNNLQVKFLEAHSYHTPTSLKRRSEKKLKNLNSIKAKLDQSQKPINMSPVKQTRLFTLSDIIYLVLSVAFASLALKSFLVPNHFLDGGVTGISLLLFEMYDWNLGLLLILLNLPFLVLAYYKVGKFFCIRSVVTVVLIAVTLHWVPFPEVTHDKLLVAMFGGFFLGIGFGLGMRGGGTFDGMEVLALMTFKRTSLSIVEIILGMNIILFIIASTFIKIETALYATLTYIIAGQTTRYVIEGIEAYIGVTIVSGNSEAIKKALVLRLNRGITVYKGERGFMKDSFEVSKDVDIIFTVVTRLEVRRLRKIVHFIDPKAFVFTQTVREPQGGIVKKIIKH